MKVEIPKGTGLVYVEKKNTFFAIYYVDGKQVRKSLATDNIKQAKTARDAFFATLKADGATIRGGSTLAEKIKLKPGIYIYERKPFIVKVAGVFVGEAGTREEAEKLLAGFVSASKTNSPAVTG